MCSNCNRALRRYGRFITVRCTIVSSTGITYLSLGIWNVAYSDMYVRVNTTSSSNAQDTVQTSFDVYTLRTDPHVLNGLRGVSCRPMRSSGRARR